MAQEAVVREGGWDKILDLLYCDVIFDDWERMLSAWCFLKTRAEHDELREIEDRAYSRFFCFSPSWCQMCRDGGQDEPLFSHDPFP